MSRGGSRRGGDRGDHPQVGPDGWTVTGSSVQVRPSKAGDLSNFGKISKGQPMTFGPSSVFAGKKLKSRRSPFQEQHPVRICSPCFPARMWTLVNRRSVCLHVVIEPKKLTPDLAAEPQRKRLMLQPRSKPVETAEAASPDADSDTSVDDSPSPIPPEMSEDICHEED
jgi:translation initiation factor 4G